MEVYLDNSATTKAYPEVVSLVADIMTNDYGNASSMHLKGVDAEKYLKYSKATIAGIMKVKEKEIFFTSGGTESDNWALMGAAFANHRSGKHLITTKIEHPAILRTMEHLKELGFDITYLSVNQYGQISLDELRNAIRPDTILVSIMFVNNEVGAIQPIDEAGEIIKRVNPRTLFHVDAVQGFGKLRLLPKKWKIDMVSVSGHKIHGPKGTGFLYIDEKVKIKPILYGGGQQNGYRSGTENVPGVAGLGKATELIYRDLVEDTNRLYRLKQKLVSGLLKIDHVKINGPQDETGAPHIVSASIAGIRSEVMLHSLEDKGVYVSAGSACSSHKHTVSDTLNAMGLTTEYMDSTIRFSLSVFTTEEEIEYTLKCLYELVPMLRRYTRR
ncbi:MAG: cysteine desulfurase family protein [Lachnospiraceae bacterium]|nr:cysteine desulfurase family protein [Lachnospiraceae bacterium]